MLKRWTLDDTPLWDKLRNPTCTECELYDSAQYVCLIGAGKLNPKLMIVGEAPGRREDQIAKPFAGRAGQLLDRLLEEFHLSRTEIYITNAVHCRPPDNRTPKWKEVEACRHYLISEVRHVKPQLIVAMGNIACMGLLKQRKFPIGENRGNTMFLPEEKLKHIPVIPTYHPAAALRKDYYLELILQDFERAIAMVEGKISAEKIEAHYYRGIAKDITKQVVIDIETSGLDPFAPDSQILCIGTSNKSGTGYVTTELTQARSILSDPKITKIGHNVKFDIKYLVTNGYIVKGPIYDTMAAFHLLDENYPSKGLKELAMVYTDMGDYSAPLKKTMALVRNKMAMVPASIRDRYCAQDVDATHRLMEVFTPRLKEEGLWPLFKLMMKAYKVITKAELFGFQINEKKRLELRKDYLTDIDTLSAKLEEIAGYEGFNPGSSAQLGSLLYDKLKFPVGRITKTGQPSTDEATLLELKKQDKKGIIDTILKLRELKGDFSKYLTPEKELTKGDGRVHCDYRITGTVTGRWSCKNPNLQQVPRESRIKELFISSFPHGRILQVDYSQGELRLLAEYSRDPRLLQIFDDGKYDIHLAVAAQVFKKNIDTVTKQERKYAKTVNFGIMYGEGPGKLAYQLGCTFLEARDFMRTYKAQYKGVANYIKQQEEWVLEHGEVASLFNRKRRLVILDPDTPQGKEALRQAINSPIQGGLHDLNLVSMVALDKELRSRGMDSMIIADVHDALILDVPDQEEEDILREIIPEIFCNPDTSDFGFKFRVPLKVSIGVGRSWKEASENEQEVGTH